MLLRNMAETSACQKFLDSEDVRINIDDAFYQPGFRGQPMLLRNMAETSACQKFLEGRDAQEVSRWLPPPSRVLRRDILDGNAWMPPVRAAPQISPDARPLRGKCVQLALGLQRQGGVDREVAAVACRSSKFQSVAGILHQGDHPVDFLPE